MHSLIVVAHPDPASLTHGVAARIAQAIADADESNTTAMADLMAEGFDPRFNGQDLSLIHILTLPTILLV